MLWNKKLSMDFMLMYFIDVKNKNSDINFIKKMQILTLKIFLKESLIWINTVSSNILNDFLIRLK